ncbi:MAG: nucleoside-diphosphate kinase, partial [Chthoniobacteraceae bacterium]
MKFRFDGAVRAGIWTWLKARDDLELTGLRWFHPPKELIEQHYDFLAGQPFFPWLVDFMSALPVVVGELLSTPADLERIRNDLGETQIQKARPGSVRERYGIYGGVNCLHLSDSAESGQKETRLWAKYVKFEGVHPDHLAESEGAPDHTYELRSLASQYSAGVHRDLAADRILDLL